MVTNVITKLVQSLQAIEAQKKQTQEIDYIEVSTSVSKVAFFYEKIRNTLEYNDEHLVRKNAIERILKRRLVENVTANDISRYLINELIRGGYLEDNSIPEIKIHEVSQVLNKYILLRNDILDRFSEKEVRQLYKWTLQLMACEVEETLVSAAKDNAYIKAMFRSVEPRIKIKDQKIISQKDLHLQLYITITQLLTKSDESMLMYQLFKMYHPEWQQPSKDFIIKLARRLTKIQEVMQEQLRHPIGKFLKKQLRPYAIQFSVMRRTLDEHQEDYEAILMQRDDFVLEVKKIVNGIYKNIRGKLRRSVVRSIIYLFVTKMILAFIIEMPFDMLFYGHIAYVPLYINIFFPPILLFLITMSARVPSKRNTEALIEGVQEFVYTADNPAIICEIKHGFRRGKFLKNFFKVMYVLTFVISYGAFIWLLYRLDFNLVSGGLFLLFLSLVSYFGIRVRRLSKDFVVIARKETLLTFLLDIFSYPIIRVGQWISEKTSQVNVFIFILDVIIEAPFKTLVEVFDQWTNYLKEKREELY